MKEVILSADGDSVVYSVPDAVAGALEAFCMEFCCDWLWHAPEAARYRTKGVVSYTEADFIDYLNVYRFPEEPSVLVKNLGWTEFGKKLPKEYQGLPYFNF